MGVVVGVVIAVLSLNVGRTWAQGQAGAAGAVRGPVPWSLVVGDQPNRWSWRVDARVGVALQTDTVAGPSGVALGGDALAEVLYVRGTDRMILGLGVGARPGAQPAELRQWFGLWRTYRDITVGGFTHELVLGRPPSLLDAPRLPPRTTHSETLTLAGTMHGGLEETAAGTSGALLFAPLEITVSYQFTDDAVTAAGHHSELALVRSQRYHAGQLAWQLDILSGVVDAMGDGRLVDDDGVAAERSAWVANAALARLVRVVGPLRWDVAAGWIACSSTVRPTGAPSEVAIRREIWSAGGHASLAVDGDAGTARVELSRRGVPTYDGRTMVDNQIAVSFERGRDTWTVRADGRVGVGRVAGPEPAWQPDRTLVLGAVTGSVSVSVGAGLSLAAYAEVGRGPYAAGASLDEPAWGGAAGLSLGVRRGTAP